MDPAEANERISDTHCQVCSETRLLCSVHTILIQGSFKSTQQFHISATHFYNCRSYTLTISLYTYSAECLREMPVKFKSDEDRSQSKIMGQSLHIEKL